MSKKNGKDHIKLINWSNFISVLANSLSKIIWAIIALILVASIGSYMHTKNNETYNLTKAEREKIIKTIPINQINKEIVNILKVAEEKTQTTAEASLDEWINAMQERIDENFLPWYFGYWSQQVRGLKYFYYTIYYTITDFFRDKPTAAEKITEDIQKEFANRVLRPEVAQLEIERITQTAVSVFVKEISDKLSEIPIKYKIPQPAWEVYLNGLAKTAQSTEGGRQINFVFKVGLVESSAIALKKIAIPIVRKSMFTIPNVASIASKSTIEVAAPLAKRKAAKTVGGKFLGPIVAVTVIVWDVIDHYTTEKEQKPILRKNLVDYLHELKLCILNEIMITVQSIEGDIITSLEQNRKMLNLE